MGVNIHTPWIIIGDFNHLLNIEDRIGGQPVTLNDVEDFQRCTVDIELHDHA